MEHLIKQKFYGKLLNFLKFKRHRKIRTLISFSRKKMDLSPGASPNFNLQKRQYFLKKVDSFCIDPLATSGSFLQKNNTLDLMGSLKNETSFSENSTAIGHTYRSIKKKYRTSSFLFNVLCQFSRSRLKYILGKEILSRYYTIPYRLSLSRFIGNKVSRSFYRNLNKKTLLRLCNKIIQRAKRSRDLTFSHSPSSAPREEDLHVSRKEISKNIILSLEKRLDSSLLRLFQFKALYTKKLTDQSVSQVNSFKHRYFPRKIKSP
jgi:hypothetical protein